jgi:hypothetical protein
VRRGSVRCSGQSPLMTSEGCFDAEILAAWADGALDDRKSSLVELHASNCSRCMAMLASVERTRPEVEAPPKRAWAIGPLLRWGVPLTAAATAIAIWVMVPNRSLTRLEPAGARPGYVYECNRASAGNAGTRTGAEPRTGSVRPETRVSGGAAGTGRRHPSSGDDSPDYRGQTGRGTIGARCAGARKRGAPATRRSGVSNRRSTR